ncbi:MAG: NAD(P)-dependent oxidoreductase [Myxococcales bacterium]|nr:NAD(P)-dependent oxidoreductase [Myxococcales bacterium]MDH3485376.1 NAD(P)-dependent oxidoreductase [Myxococcales bacterium]
MRCLVTGATGFIGGAILRGLQAAGHEVVAYVREGSDSRALNDVERIVGDLADPNRLAVAAGRCDVMVHAAGIADPRTDRETLGWAHVAGTENAINAAKKAGCQRMIHISCADVTLYDGPRSFWNEDEAPTRPVGALAQTKLHAEELVRVSGNRDFRTIVLRPALVWGPGDPTHFPGWQAEAKNGGVRLVGGGKKLLATTYTDNLVEAVLRAIETDVPTGSVYYIVDTELSVARDFFTELCETLGWSSPRKGGPNWWAMALCRARLSPLHPTQVIRRGQTSAFDMTKAKKELGYEPVVTREQGMAELGAWARQMQGTS